MLIIHFLGLAMGVGVSFANLFLGIKASKLEPQERGKLMSGVNQPLLMMGKTGLTLLLISGFYLATPYWSNLNEMPYFIIKLCLVAALIFVVVMITIISTKAKKENNPALLAKLKPWGMVGLIIGVLIITMAVNTFH